MTFSHVPDCSLLSPQSSPLKTAHHGQGFIQKPELGAVVTQCQVGTGSLLVTRSLCRENWDTPASPAGPGGNTSVPHRQCPSPARASWAPLLSAHRLPWPRCQLHSRCIFPLSRSCLPRLHPHVSPLPSCSPQTTRLPSFRVWPLSYFRHHYLL